MTTSIEINYILYKLPSIDCFKRAYMDFKMEGFSLIEMLIALSILAVGLFALGKFQIEALRQSHNAFLSSVACYRLTGMAEQWEAMGVPARTVEVARWNQENQTFLGGSEGRLVGHRLTLRLHQHLPLMLNHSADAQTVRYLDLGTT